MVPVRVDADEGVVARLRLVLDPLRIAEVDDGGPDGVRRQHERRVARFGPRQLVPLIEAHDLDGGLSAPQRTANVLPTCRPFALRRDRTERGDASDQIRFEVAGLVR